MELTDRFIHGLRATGTQQDYSDSVVKQFGVRMSSDGTKTFWLRYRNREGCQKRHTVGHVGDIKLAEARAAALQLKRAIKKKSYPDEALASGPTGETFGTVRAAYIEDVQSPEFGKVGNPPTVGTWLDRERAFDRDWSDWDSQGFLDVVTRDNVTKRLALIKRKYGPYVKNDHQAFMSALYTWAMDNGYAPGVQAHPLLRIGKEPEEKRKVVMSEDQLRSMWWAPVNSEKALAISRLQLLTMQRGQEVKMMRREQIKRVDDGAWWVRPSRIALPTGERIRMIKNGEDHWVWLPAMALKIVDEQLAKHDDQWVFPSDSKYGFQTTAQSAIERARDVATDKNFRLHDLRRTGATLTSEELGYTDALIQKALNHTDPTAGVTPIYNRNPFAREKREILEAWAKIVLRIVGTKRPVGIPEPSPKWRRDPKDLKALADRIWAARKRLGLNQREFADAVGVKYKTVVSKWERGVSMPQKRFMPKVEALCKKAMVA
jgi:integrase/DNA-binding XRE family transcriptional regulator